MNHALSRRVATFGIGVGRFHARRATVPMELPAQPRIRCREITLADLENIIDLLTIGFQQDRKRSYWVNAINRLAEHPTPPGYPQYGYLLESNGVAIGVLLLIFSSRVTDDLTAIRCNGSSLYVQPEFRGYAAILIKRALRYKGVTYLNITAARHTWPMLAAQGYEPFTSGVYLALPAMCRSAEAHIQMATTETCVGLKEFETEILVAHTSYGCLSVVCESEGEKYPFVFGLGRKYGVRLAYLTYCRDQHDFVRFAGALGRFLVKQGYPVVVLDANSSIDGLIGKYFAVRPKYAMGPENMRFGDLPYTERVMFGF